MMGFDDVAVIGDLDCVFCLDTKYLLEELQLGPKRVDSFRAHIGWTGQGDPSLEVVFAGVKKSGEPPDLAELLARLEQARVFVLRQGAPEHYRKAAKLLSEGIGPKLRPVKWMADKGRFLTQ